jgi:hypothetical protein
MPAQYVKAYVKRNKNDAADAAAMNGTSSADDESPDEIIKL